ncbi:MAG: DUF2314 domain-containing protein [Deltaproteobacteria bacterium]|nr:DUF2314 domain-containing protein [Deltaproteobacteria bacterium]
MRNLAWLVAVALLGGCKEKDRAVDVRPASEPAQPKTPVASKVPTEGALAAKGSLSRRPFAFFAVIVPEGGNAEKLLAAGKTAAEKLGFRVVTKPGDDVGKTLLIDKTTPDAVGWKDVGEPLGEFVPEKDRAAIKASTLALGIVGSGDANGPRTAHDTALVVKAVAEASKGWIMDLDTHLLHTPASLMAHVPGEKTLDVRDSVMLHGVSGDNNLAFVDTVGMSRLGLPELYVGDIPQSRVSAVSRVLNATAQTLVERGDLTRDGELEVDVSKLAGDWQLSALQEAGGTGKIVWRATWSRGDAKPGGQIDADQLVLQLSIAGAKPGSAEALLAALEKFEGAVEDKVTYVDYDKELAEAGVKARAALAKLRPHFAKGIPPNEQLGVKAPFDTDDGNIEWMWVDVVSFRGDVLDGTLDNDPAKVSKLKLGSRVKVKFGELADFIHQRADGSRAGGYSLEVFRAHGENVPPL